MPLWLSHLHCLLWWYWTEYEGSTVPAASPTNVFATSVAFPKSGWLCRSRIWACHVPCVRPCVRPSVRVSLDFRALARVRRPSPRPLYSVGDCYMIQLNDFESLVSGLQVFLDHRARAPLWHTNLVLSPCMGPNPYSGSWPGYEGLGWGGGGPKSKKVKKSIFGRSFCFDPTSLTESPATSYAASRPLSHPLTHLNPSRTLHIRALSSGKVVYGVGMSTSAAVPVRN